MKNLKMLFASALVLGSSVLGSSVAIAHEYHAGKLDIAHPWARPLPTVATVGSAYFTVTNKGDTDDVLLSAESPIADKVEIHTHIKEGDVMKMRQVNDLVIPAHGEQKLAPGGLHLMLMGLKEVPAVDTKFPVTLHFKQAGKVEIEVAVEAEQAADTAPHDHAGHGKTDQGKTDQDKGGHDHH
ncbi:MAG: copper chaperone PCu(A)C [Candidatus Oceanisphaera merdipullorum]|nr:copper chaperone PCu(A)C [Candidatus Oceanisphaera merdipullorum]